VLLGSSAKGTSPCSEHRGEEGGRWAEEEEEGALLQGRRAPWEKELCSLLRP
jgi:hypothetical protein